MTTMIKRSDQINEDADDTQGCIGSIEFEQAVARVGLRPYSEIMKSQQEAYEKTVQLFIANGGPSPEEFVRQLNAKRTKRNSDETTYGVCWSTWLWEVNHI